MSMQLTAHKGSIVIPRGVILDNLRDIARKCPMCGAAAVVPLTKGQLSAQPDATNAVCHPALKGCNQGFETEGFKIHL